MPEPQDVKHLHREIKASTPELKLTILLINSLHAKNSKTTLIYSSVMSTS